MNDEDHREQNPPSDKGANSAAELLLVQQDSDRHGTNYLANPINSIIQCPTLDGEQRSVEVVELIGIKLPG